MTTFLEAFPMTFRRSLRSSVAIVPNRCARPHAGFTHCEPSRCGRTFSYDNGDSWGHLRASSRAAAKAKLRAKCPTAKFYR